VLLALAGFAGSAPSDPSEPSPGVIQARHDTVAARLAEVPADDDVGRRWHQLRHVDAMSELVAQLPVDRRPRHLLYLAGGAHLAPLGLCELLPEGQPCSLTSTDADPDVGDAIGLALADLAETGQIQDLTGGAGRWRFRLADHPITLALQQVPAGPVAAVDPSWLDSADLVIIHDWSGDPIETVRVVYGVLRTARSVDTDHPPMVMVEDLERHPYPIDLGLLSPAARTVAPYGHRGSLVDDGGHAGAELGAPIFGGAVLLELSDLWWRRVSPDILRAVFDLLLFNEFLDQRRNVLEGGADPLLAPALLDWWTGFGARTVAGGTLGDLDRDLVATASAAAEAATAMEPANRRRLACRLQLLRALAHASAAGADIAELMPSAELTRRPDAGTFPNPEMAAAHRESLRRAGDFRAARAVRTRQAAGLAAALDSTSLRDVLSACPIVEPAAGDDPAELWSAAYRRLADSLRSP